MRTPPSHAPRAPPWRPSSRHAPFLLGRDSRGNWVVRDQAGLCGAIFVERSEALRFAMLENDHHPRAVIMVPGILDFSIGGPTKAFAKNPKSVAETKSDSATGHGSHGPSKASPGSET
jgi:hypothetical protein